VCRLVRVVPCGECLRSSLLTLNSSKTDFLLIGLKNQLAKIHNSSLDTSHSACNLSYIFDEHLTFADQITALSKACYYHIRQLRCIRPYQLPVPLLPLSFTPNLITVIISTINSRSLNYPVFSRSRTLLIVRSWKLPNHVTSLLSYALFTDSELLNASNTSSSHLPTKFSQLPNLHTFISSFPLNVLAVLDLHRSLLFLGYLHHPL